MHLISLGLLCLIVSAPSLIPQKAVPTASPSEKPKTKPSDPLSIQKRMVALSLLTSLAEGARSYRDESLRAQVQARVADALWDYDRPRATVLFRRAWDAAEIAEPPASRITNSISGSATKGALPRRGTTLRAEVLRLVARRDHVLAEEFLIKLTTIPDNGSVAERGDRPDPSAAEINERLRLGNVLLTSDDIDRALEIVAPVILRPVSGRSIQFLISLREKNALVADEWFKTIVFRAGEDATADANTVSLLTSYAFTPSVVLIVSRSGIPSAINYEPKPAPNLKTELRQTYFRVSANILLRPFGQLDQTSAGRAGTYYIARRLLPLFQQHASDLAGPIAAQVAALAPDSREQNFAEERLAERGIASDPPVNDRTAFDLQRRLERARNADERDRAYGFAAMSAAGNGDSQARDYVSKIEDVATRKGIGSFVDFTLVEGLLRKKNIDEALRLTRNSNLGHVQLTRILTQVGGILTDKDPGRARELLEESLKEVLCTEVGSPERAYALVAIVARFTKIDRIRSWELLHELVKAANASAVFTGENGMASLELEGKFSIRLGIELAASDDLPNAVQALAQDDFYQAINVVKTFQEEAPKALATLAIARGALEAKQR